MEKDYLIITNRNKRRLVFYPVAKNANTSVRLFLIKHLSLENRFYFTEDSIPAHKLNITDLENYKNQHSVTQFLPPYTKFRTISVEEKACLIREPIERFVSAYKNRILFHKDENFKNHSIDEILEKLENQLFENKHFLPQTYWLGNDLNYFTIKANIKNLESFIRSINNFFMKEIEFPKLQTGGKEFLIDLKHDHKEKIKKIYSSDYDLVKGYL